MKFIIPLFLLIGITTANGQRNVKVGKKELDSLFIDDVNYWRNYASKHISGYLQPIIEISNESGKTWGQKEINPKLVNEFLIRKNDRTPVIDLEGNITYYVENREIELLKTEFLCFSENNQLKNKIGFGYSKYDDMGVKVSSHIFFVDYKNFRFLKDQRRINFLQLLSLGLPVSKQDSIINMNVNNEKTNLHVFYFPEIYSNSSGLNGFIEYLFRSYEVDFANMFYSGRDSSYSSSDDEWGNITMRANKPKEFLVTIWDEDGNQSSKRTIPYTMNIDFIKLYFDKQVPNTRRRFIFPGISSKTYNFTGYYIASISYYIQPDYLKRFSKSNQILLEYLYELYN